MWLDGLSYNKNMKDCQASHLKFPPGIEFLQAFHSLLPVHHGSYSGPLLQEVGEIIIRIRIEWKQWMGRMH